MSFALTLPPALGRGRDVPSCWAKPAEISHLGLSKLFPFLLACCNHSRNIWKFHVIFREPFEQIIRLTTASPCPACIFWVARELKVNVTAIESQGFGDLSGSTQCYPKSSRNDDYLFVSISLVPGRVWACGRDWITSVEGRKEGRKEKRRERASEETTSRALGPSCMDLAFLPPMRLLASSPLPHFSLCWKKQCKPAPGN